MGPLRPIPSTQVTRFASACALASLCAHTIHWSQACVCVRTEGAAPLLVRALARTRTRAHADPWPAFVRCTQTCAHSHHASAHLHTRLPTTPPRPPERYAAQKRHSARYPRALKRYPVKYPARNKAVSCEISPRNTGLSRGISPAINKRIPRAIKDASARAVSLTRGAGRHRGYREQDLAAEWAARVLRCRGMRVCVRPCIAAVKCENAREGGREEKGGREGGTRLGFMATEDRH